MRRALAETLARPELEPYVSLRDRDLAGRGDGLFVAEGEVVVRVLASPRQTRFRVRSLLVEQRRVEAIRDVIDALPDDVPVYVVAQPVMDAVVGFAIHRGILALGERGAPLAPESLLTGGGLAIGLVGLTNHDNVGSVFRSAAAFGARGVLLDAATCDPLYRKSIRVSVGGALVVPFARCASARGDARHRGGGRMGGARAHGARRGDARFGRERTRLPPRAACSSSVPRATDCPRTSSGGRGACGST